MYIIIYFYYSYKSVFCDVLRFVLENLHSKRIRLLTKFQFEYIHYYAFSTIPIRFYPFIHKKITCTHNLVIYDEKGVNLYQYLAFVVYIINFTNNDSKTSNLFVDNNDKDTAV